jgi:hypothetical protein
VSLTFTGDHSVFYFDSSGDALTLWASEPTWSVLYATSGVVNLKNARLAVFGGGVTINRASVPAGYADDDAVSISQTNGVADAVSGDDLTVGLNASQVVITGGDELIGATAGVALPGPQVNGTRSTAPMT